MRRVCTLAGILLVSAPLWAQVGTSSLSWINPTTYTDGSALTLGYIHIERSANTVGPYTRIASLGPTELWNQSYIDSGLYNSTYCYRLIAEDNQFNLESVPSNVACKTVSIASNDPSQPAPPTMLTVQ